jgi:hypothetical protein
MMMLSRLVILSSLFAGGVLAYPSGAGSCVGGQSAVGGSHLGASLRKEGSLEMGSLTFAINGISLMSDTTMDIPIGMSHTWTLSVDMDGFQARPFKGFLVRLNGGGVGVEDALDMAISRQNSMIQPAQACDDIEGVAGVTHVDSEEKTCVSGVLLLDEAADGMIFDITVVIENNSTKSASAHFWSSYTVNAVTTGGEDIPVDLGCAAFSSTSVPSSAETMAVTGAESSEKEMSG